MIQSGEEEGKDQEIFWGEIAPCSHLLQIYENDEVFLNTLFGYVSSGINAGDGVVIIATITHINGLIEKLILEGFNVKELDSSGQFLTIEVEEALSMFMVNDRPDPVLFRKFVTSLLVRSKGRKIRAFGEMVAILWEKGLNGATVQLEHMWNEFCKSEIYSLFCAYPKSGFTNDAKASIQSICEAHTQVISGKVNSNHHIHYINQKAKSNGR